MSDWVSRFRARRFAEVPRDHQAYHAEIRWRLCLGAKVLDVGCGKGLLDPYPWEAHPDVHVVGLDPDPEAESNPGPDEFRQLRPGEPWPMDDESVDLVICRYVVEHVEDPSDFMQNARRVMRPGGRMIFLTPGKYYPVMLVSALLPHSMHRRILGSCPDSGGKAI